MAFQIIALEQYEIQSEGMTVSKMIWRRYRRPMIGLLEVTLELPENYLLEHQDAMLTPGAIVFLPVVRQDEFGQIQVITLWD